MAEQIYEGEPTTQEELDWINIGKDMSKNSLDRLRNEAKELTTLSSSILAVYTGAITLFKLNNTISSVSFVILIIPIIFWLISIYYSNSINFSELQTLYINSPSDVRTLFNDTIIEKYKKIYLSRKLFVLAIMLSVIALIIVGFGPEKLTSKNVQFLIDQDSISELKNISIPMEDDNILTVPVELIGQSSKGYTIKLPTGSVVEIDSDMVNGIIYT